MRRDWPGMRPAAQSSLLVADRDAAQRVAIELTRNRLIAHPDQRLLLAGSTELSLLRSFLRQVRPDFRFTTCTQRGMHDLAVLGAEPGGTVVARDAVILPGVSATSVAVRCETRLVVGRAAGAVIVVPGTAADRDGIHALTAETFGRLRRAEDLAGSIAVRAVILSGWNGFSGQGMTEAEQMMRAWAGPDVPLILDEAARTTAENGLCSAAIIEALGDVRDVIVVASWANAVRLRLAFTAALRGQDSRPKVSIVWGLRHGASWRPGIAGLARLRRHLIAGRAMLEHGRQHPDASVRAATGSRPDGRR